MTTLTLKRLRSFGFLSIVAAAALLSGCGAEGDSASDSAPDPGVDAASGAQLPTDPANP